ncbi:hypothetical protein [Clostridium sp. DJ247]|uniref:hypothetical protein n=1 Tax=Clostridium sp. DJ247 TaxID=2726188 RepID=UPI001625FA87|nr:hypothetical protein [Clostridium sp. DJ247]MBC2578813.1 hypothetical protein [Clostridium sp. DJ247]
MKGGEKAAADFTNIIQELSLYKHICAYLKQQNFMDIVKLISNLPKVELHCHLDGSVRPETVLEISNKENILLPSKDILELEKHLKVQDQCTSLKDYLKKFDLVLKVMQKPEYLYRITLELLEDSYKANVKYIEIRFSPQLFINEKMDFHEAVKSIIAAVDEGKKRFGVIAKLILICMRHHSLETNIAIVEQGKD